MKTIFAGIVCLFFGFNALAQTENDDDADTKTPEVEAIFLLRDDGTGKGGEETESFTTSDKILHFRIQLSSRKSASVKLILVAANVSGIKPETKSMTVSYKTNGKQNIVNFKASPEDSWSPGKYRADVFIDGSLSNKKEFEIQKTAKETEAEKTSPPKSIEKTSRKTLKRTKKT